jgi:hypothetical protein
MVVEENQIQSVVTKMMAPITSTTVTLALITTPTTLTAHPLLPRYNGKRINNSDLLQAIDRADHKLFEAFDLVNSVSGQITRVVSSDCHGSTRPTRVTTHERLGTSLAIMATPEGQIV